MSNRAFRRAAQRQALKAEKKRNQQSMPANNPPVLPSEEILNQIDPDELMIPELLALAEKYGPAFEETAKFEQSRRRRTGSNPSTGPTSPEGKQASSRNALKHGSCSTATLILENESLDDFLTLENRWFQGYGVNPANALTAYEAELIRTAARADWFFQRADRNYAEAEAQIFAAQPNLLLWDETHHRSLARFLRYRTTHTNSLAKHRKAIEDYRKSRASELVAAQKLDAVAQKLEVNKERARILKEKNKPEPTWHEEIENMRRQAVALGFTPKPRPTDPK